MRLIGDNMPLISDFFCGNDGVRSDVRANVEDDISASQRSSKRTIGSLFDTFPIICSKVGMQPNPVTCDFRHKAAASPQGTH
jgi:hypothetical protein